jgi:hypothetical protein
VRCADRDLHRQQIRIRIADRDGVAAGSREDQSSVFRRRLRRDLPKWSWKKVLGDVRRLAPAPQLIVVSRTADDFLWSEVLNFGGYDVLAQPLVRDEVERVIASARRHFDVRPERAQHAAAAAIAQTA